MVVLGRVGKVATGAATTVLVARLGLPALGGLVLLTVLVLGMICWIISSDERSARVSRMMLARRGDAKCLETSASPPPLPKARARRQSTPLGTTPMPQPDKPLVPCPPPTP